jgi:tetratricopeptide (TPR) repeat protein
VDSDMSDPLSTQDQEPSTRIGATIPANIVFGTDEMSSFTGDIMAGFITDVSVSGLRCEVTELPDDMPAKLQQAGEHLRLEIDLELGKRNLRVSGKSAWLKISDEKGSKACSVGVTYDDVDEGTRQFIADFATRQLKRPIDKRWWIVSVFLCLVVGALVHWQTQKEYIDLLQNQRIELSETLHLKNTLAKRLELAQQKSMVPSEVDKAVVSKSLQKARKKEMAASIQEQKRLKNKIYDLTKRIGKLTNSLAKLETKKQGSSHKGANVHLNMAYKLSANGMNNNAIRQLKKAIKVDTSFAEAYLEMGRLYEKLERKSDAVKAYKQFFKLRPKSHKARELRTYVHQLEDELGAGGHDHDHDHAHGHHGH